MKLGENMKVGDKVYVISPYENKRPMMCTVVAVGRKWLTLSGHGSRIDKKTGNGESNDRGYGFTTRCFFDKSALIQHLKTVAWHSKVQQARSKAVNALGHCLPHILEHVCVSLSIPITPFDTFADFDASVEGE